MNAYKHLIRPLLFKLNPEATHAMARALLRCPYSRRLFGGQGLFIHDERLRVNLGGLTISNPVGLAAGFDKDCDMVNSLMGLGFGYIVPGSVMYHPRPGNPCPRIIRDPEREAVYSCMGLPSRGLDYALKQLGRRRYSNVPLIINLNAENYDDYLKTFEALQPFGEALEITLYCPNRPNDAGDFLSPGVAERLLVEIVKRKKKPVFIKIPGYRSENERRKRLNLVEHILKFPLEGITITPESLVDEGRLSIGRGTVTGRPMFRQTLSVVRDVYRLTKDKWHIRASGGIFTSVDAFEAITAGASTVEIFTGFIYEGWCIARNINQGLLNLMKKFSIENVTALRGAELKIGTRLHGNGGESLIGAKQ